MIPAEEVLRILNKESGLAGISGLSGDFRELIKSTTDDAQFALEYFVNGIVRSIGEMTAILGGINALVFTGGIGANSPLVRHRVCSHLEWLGLHLNNEANNKNNLRINHDESKVEVYSLKADEEKVMALRVSRLMKEQ